MYTVNSQKSREAVPFYREMYFMVVLSIIPVAMICLTARDIVILSKTGSTEHELTMAHLELTAKAFGRGIAGGVKAVTGISQGWIQSWWCAVVGM